MFQKFQEDRLQFLHDMIYYYGNNPKRRAIVMDSNSYSHQPRYKTEDGRYCPVGRYMHKEKNLLELRGSLKALHIVDKTTYRKSFVEIEDYLPEKIYLLGLNFLTAVTALHDHDGFWHKFGLSYSGQNCYNEIKRNYCESFMVEYDHNF